jgi:undecaprenyl-diphosphatase
MVAAAAALMLMDPWIGRAQYFDESVRMMVHSAASAWMTEFFQAETWLGASLVLLGVCVLAALFLKGAHTRILCLASFGGAWALTEIAKAVVRRPRPVAFVGHSPDSGSFPSGHALESAAVYWTIAAIAAERRHRVAGLLIGTLPLITGLSRVYLGVHYPTDVIAGWIAGACWSAGVVGALRLEAERGPLPYGRGSEKQRAGTTRMRSH